jgi:hypothetical protein
VLVLLTRSTTCYGKKNEAWAGERVGPLVAGFLLQPVTPEAMLEFEQSLQRRMRSDGLLVNSQGRQLIPNSLSF